MTSHRFLVCAFLSLSCLLAAARAHFLWIEPAEGGAPVVRFGEYESGVRETSPGRLDAISGVDAFALDERGRVQPLQSERQTDGLLLREAPAGRPLAVEFAGMEVKDWRRLGHGLTKPVYYARFAPTWPVTAAATPVLALDLVPLPGGRVQVSFRGAPCKEARVHVHAPNGWSRGLDLDDEGCATVPTPWPGLTVVEALHVEAASGEYEGKPYDSVRHRATLALTRQMPDEAR